MSTKRATQFGFRELQLAQLSKNLPKPAAPAENRTILGSSAPDELRRKRKHSADEQSLNGLIPLALPEAVRSGVRASRFIRQKHESPWAYYRKLYMLQLGDDESDRLFVTMQREDPFDVVSIRRLSGSDIDEKIAVIQALRHQNIVSPLEIFRFQHSVYVAFEHMPISLYHIAGNPEIDELNLAAILGQIVAGLEFIADNGREHSSLSSASVVLGPDGHVKIFDQESCQLRKGCQDIRALGSIATELMDGFTREDGVIGVQDLQRWPADSKAVRFVSETTSAESPRELLNHALLQLPWRKEHLKGVFSFAMVEMGRLFKYPAD